MKDYSIIYFVFVKNVFCWGIDYYIGISLIDIGDVKDGIECE